MRKDLIESIEFPGEINVAIENGKMLMSKGNDKLERRLDARINFKIEGNKIVMEAKNSTKNERKVFGSLRAHINNMIKGLNEKFKYKLQIASVHFPVTTEIDKNNNEFVVKNFLGEKKPRRIKLVKGVDVNVNKEIIELESADIEKAGQCASNIEKGTKVRNRDRRIFQDGIFIIEKPGRSLL